MTSRFRRACAQQGRTGLRMAIAAAGLIGLLFPDAVAGQECQNQAKIDVCKAGCTATGEVCGALCGAAVDVCTGTCIGGCATTCTIDCCAGLCTGSDACRRCIGNCEDDCEDACQLECDECIFDCERDCESICRPFKKIGESCVPLVDRCADGLTCWPFLFQCFPSENDELYPDDKCRSLYSSGVHEGAIDGNVAWSFGTGGASAVGVSETLETGNVYGPDGRYGCYFTICLGGTTDVEVGLYASTGIYTSYDDFKGESVAFIKEAGEGVVFSTAQIINTSGDLIGTADCLSIELSLAPIAVGVYDCTTIVDTVGIRQPDGSLMPVENSPPTAICDDRVVCADGETCDAAVNVDGGSIDPDNDPLVLVHDPPGPYGIGSHDVVLEVADLDGASDFCFAHVQVNDCTPPEIICPESVVVECEGDGETFMDPGDAVVFDCTKVIIEDNEPQAFPLGETTLTYSAEDELGQSSSCEQTISVVSDDTDGDGLVDCLDQCPFVRANSPTGCGGLPLSFFDSDEDGVTDDVDECPDTPEGIVVGDDGCPAEEPPTQPVPDSDGDGVRDDLDLCADTPSDDPVDEDGCPVQQPVGDNDGDGVNDDLDFCPDTADRVEVDEDGCPIDEPPTQPVTDTDGDGVPDDLDLCPDTPLATVDEDGCTIEEEEQQVPDHGTLEGPCGSFDLSTLLMLPLGLAGLRWMGEPRRGNRSDSRHVSR